MRRRRSARGWWCASSGTAIDWPMVLRGLSDDPGFWNTICTWREMGAGTEGAGDVRTGEQDVAHPWARAVP